MKDNSTPARQDMRGVDRLTRSADFARVLVLAVGACDRRRLEVDEREAAALEAFTLELADELDALGGYPQISDDGVSS